MKLYEKLLEKKKMGSLYPFHQISPKDLEQLYLKENLTSKTIAELFDVTKGQVDYRRYKFNIRIRKGVVDEFLKMESDQAQSINKMAGELLLEEDRIGVIAKAITKFSLGEDTEIEISSRLNSISEIDVKKLKELMANRLAYILELIINEDWIKLNYLIESNKDFDKDWKDPIPDDANFEKTFRSFLEFR